MQGTGEEAKEAYFGYRAAQGLTEGYRYYFERVDFPEEMANVAMFLASHLASATNSQSVAADMGLTDGTLADQCLGGIPEVKSLVL